MKKFLSIFLATSMVMSVCVATASVASAEVSSVELPTIYGQSYTWEAEAYADVINEQIYGTGSAKATICEQTYDNNSATAHETSKASGGKALMSGGVMPTTDAAPVKLTLPIYVPVETVYELEVVAGNESRVNANNYFALDGETIFTTTGGTSLTNNLGGTVTAEKLGWTAKKSDNGFYYQANKLTTRITIPAGNHTIEFAVPPRPSATYGGFMLDYIKLTSYGARGRVTLPTENSGYYTWEAEAYADVINEQIYGTGSVKATICEQTYDNNSATAHETSKASGGKALMSGGVMPTTDAAPVKLTLPIYVPVETVYELEVVAGNDSRVNVNNYFALDGETIFTTTGGTSLTNNLGGTVTAEKLGWTAKKSDNGFYYQANKLTTRITIPAGNHTIEFAVPPRPNATYGGFMLDYIKLTSCGVVKAYKTVEADNNFTRFEMSKSFTNGETKTIKFTPSRTADYSLSVGTGAYRGTDITTDIASLSFTVTDSNGTKIMENLAVTPSPRNIQRVGANDFTADNLALEAGKEYTISVTATLNDGKTEGSISYIDLRCLTLDIGTQPALISAFDYYKIAHNGGGSTGGPNANTYWTAAKWNQMGSNLIGNYMDEDLAAKNECATSFHNANATYKLNFTESGTYKVRLYGLNLAILNEGEASPKAAVSLDGDTLGTAVYDNDTDGLADATISTKRTLAPMDCPHTLYVTAGTYDMVVDTQSPDKLSIAGIVIEKVPSVSFAETVITDETTTVTANADYQNRTDESVTLYVALYDVNGRLLKVESTYSTESTDTLSKTVSLVPNTYTAKAFVWGDNLEPLYEYAAISKISSVIACWGDSLTAGADGLGTTYPGVLAGKVGSNYTVLNMGIGGETAWTIAGRQGGIPMQVNEFTIPADTEKVEITFANNVNPLLQGDKGINPCYINSIEGTLSYDAELEKYYFSRTNAGEETAVSQGTIVETKAMRERNNDILILWVGSNGPHGTDDPETLIDIQKKMIAQNNSENYLIVGLTIEDAAKRSKLEIASRKEFGNKYLNLRKYLSNEETLRQAGITPTENDLDDIKHGRVPDSLHYDDPVHLNALGYTLTANAIYDRIKELGYVK